MPIYFLLHDAEFFGRLGPALGDAWRRRSFDPCRVLCQELLESARQYQQRYYTGPDQSLIHKVAAGLAFDRHYWQYLAGEILLIAAREIPEIPADPVTLGYLLNGRTLATESAVRADFQAIEQAYLGSQDVILGGKLYRPEHAGLNRDDDLKRIMAALSQVRPARWAPADLAPLLADADAEELLSSIEYARGCLTALLELYQRAIDHGWVIVTEMH